MQTAGFKHEIFSVKEVISQSVTPFLVAMDLKGINFIDMSSDFEVKGDDNWSTEAFANIIKNCLEHTEEMAPLQYPAKLQRFIIA